MAMSSPNHRSQPISIPGAARNGHGGRDSTSSPATYNRHEDSHSHATGSGTDTADTDPLLRGASPSDGGYGSYSGPLRVLVADGEAGPNPALMSPDVFTKLHRLQGQGVVSRGRATRADVSSSSHPRALAGTAATSRHGSTHGISNGKSTGEPGANTNALTKSAVHHHNQQQQRAEPYAPAPSKKQLCIIALAVSLYVIFLSVPLMSQKNQDAQKMLAVLCAVVLLWATEAIPLWVTSMSIPFLVICGEIHLQDTPAKSAERLLKDLMDPTVVLILGGFTLAAALHKFHIDRRIAWHLLSRAATYSVPVFLLVLMILGAFISMWIGNVVSPVILIFLVVPMLRTVEDEAYQKCVCLGIAMSCNIGGMLTPVASPQNAVALYYLNGHIPGVEPTVISFVEWMSVAVPFCSLLLLCAWGLLLLMFRPMSDALRPLPATHMEPMSWRHWYVVAVCLLTIGLWCTFHYTENYFGNLGTIGLVPIILLYPSGVLSTRDFNHLDWNILFLLGGGAALGDSVEASGLLSLVAKWLQDHLDDVSDWGIFALFNSIIMLCTNFISHTVGAYTTLQTVGTVGASIHHTKLLVFSGVLSCSGACALPVSSFPNVLVYSVKNNDGERYLSMYDYLKAGAAFQTIFLALMLSVGWFLFLGLGY